MFDHDRYFDVFVEYAKASPEDILIQITVHNRGPEPATLHVLPTLWFRNMWSWGAKRPGRLLRQAATSATGGVIAASHPELGERLLLCEGAAALLFTENETNTERLFSAPNRTPYVKDGIDDYIVHGRREAVNPEKHGDEGGGPLSAHRGGRGIADPPAAPLRRGAGRIGSDEARPVRERLRRRDASAPSGSGRVLRRGHPVLA